MGRNSIPFVLFIGLLLYAQQTPPPVSQANISLPVQVNETKLQTDAAIPDDTLGSASTAPSGSANVPAAPTISPEVDGSAGQEVVVPEPVVNLGLTPSAASPSSQTTERNEFVHCAAPACIAWTRQFRVAQTMNRWQVWDQYVGSSVMPWEQFKTEVMNVNQVLWHDGYMFKINKIYLLPECTYVEGS